MYIDAYIYLIIFVQSYIYTDEILKAWKVFEEYYVTRSSVAVLEYFLRAPESAARAS